MLTVEVECYLIKRRKDVLIESHSVFRGDIKGIDFLRPSGIMVFGPIDNKRGRVIISKKDNGLDVFKWDADHTEGREVDAKRPIEIFEGEELSIGRNRGRVTKEIVIYVESNDEEETNGDVPPEDPSEVRFKTTNKQRVPVAA